MKLMQGQGCQNERKRGRGTCDQGSINDSKSLRQERGRVQGKTDGRPHLLPKRKKNVAQRCCSQISKIGWGRTDRTFRKETATISCNKMTQPTKYTSMEGREQGNPEGGKRGNKNKKTGTLFVPKKRESEGGVFAGKKKKHEGKASY